MFYNDYAIFRRCVLLKYEIHSLMGKKMPFIIHKTTLNSGILTPGNWHKNPEFLLFTDGSGYVVLNDERVFAKKGDIVVINSNCFHNIITDSSVTYYCLIVDMGFFEENDISATSFKNLFNDKKAYLLYSSIIDTFENPSSLQTPKIRKGVLDLLIYVCEEYYLDLNTAQSYAKTIEHIKLAVSYINDNFCDKISIDEIAAFSGYSRSHLSREFKKVTGFSIVDYINNCRCDKARGLIASGKYSVFEAASLCGFDDASYFAKTYKKLLGHPPSAKIKKG